MGDHVIVVNAEKIVLTGLKSQQKVYRRYTGFPGGLREESFVRLLARRPEKIVEDAIKGMLPKNKMGRQMATKLKVYRGDKHPHQAQQPEVLELDGSLTQAKRQDGHGRFGSVLRNRPPQGECGAQFFCALAAATLSLIRNLLRPTSLPISSGFRPSVPLELVELSGNFRCAGNGQGWRE